MAIITCERCGKQGPKADKCTYCNKTICLSCLKSSRKVTKIKRRSICKGCWGNIKTRTSFKEHLATAQAQFRNREY